MGNNLASESARLKRRFAAVFIGIALSAIAGGSWYHGQYKARLRADAEKLLVSTNRMKLDQIAYWRQARLADIAALIDGPMLKQYVSRFAADSSDRDAAAVLRSRLQTYIKHNKYTYGALIDGSGNTLLSAGEKDPHLYPGVKELLPKALASGRPEMGDIHPGPDGGSAHITIIARAAGAAPGGKGIMLLLRIPPKVYLYPLLQAWSAKGATGEVLLVSRSGEDVLFLSELRHRKDAAMKLRVPVSEVLRPSVMAALGREGVVEGPDYRGARVLAAVNQVPDTGWGLVTKMDMDEVMDGAGLIGFLLALSVLSLLGLAGAAALLLFRGQAAQYARDMRQAEQRYTRLYQGMRDNFVRVSMDGYIVECNEAYCRLTGYTEEELKKLTYRQLTPERWHAMEESIVRGQIIPRGYSDLYEKEYLRKDGPLVPVELLTSLETDAAGKPSGMWAIVRDITARKAAERELQASVERLNEAQRLAQMGNWTLDLVSDKLSWSDEIYRIFEIDRERFGASYEAFLGAIHPEDREAVNKAYTDSLKNRASYNIVHRLLMKDGRIKYVNEICNTFYDPSGKPYRSEGTVQDITERVLAQKALDRETGRGAAYLEMAGVIFVAIDADQRVSLINNKGCEVLGRGKEEIIGRNWFDLAVPPAQQEEVKKAFARMMRGTGETPEHYENEVVSAGGAARLISWHNTVLRDDAGKITGTLSSGEDITERRRIEFINSARARLIQFSVTHSLDELLEETLNEAEKISGSLIGFYHFVDDDQQSLTLQNWSTRTKAQFCEAKGKGEHYPVARAGVWVDCVHQRKPVIHNDYASLAHRKGMPEGHAEVLREMVIPVFRGEKIKAILGVGNKAGDYVEKDVEAVSLLADLAWEIAERKRAELAVDSLNRVLLEKNREMENFLYITTHDLRGPLVNIQGFSQNLQHYFGEIKELFAAGGQAPGGEPRAGELTGKYIPESLGFILESSARMDAMLTALLKVSRLGRQELKPERVDAGLVVNSLADTMTFQLREAGAVLKIGQLAPCRADALSVSQIFSNLLDNALKYREEGRPLIIDISGEEAGDKAVYRVSDNGRGIPAGELEKIWNIFYSLERGGENKGEGIGLHMVKRLAESNGGGIRAESVPGQGSVFILELQAWRG